MQKDKMNLIVPLLVLINLVGFLFGIYYYWNQLAGTPPHLWLMVIDCPLFALLFAIILVAKIRSNWFNMFVATGLIKYGLWTVFVILLMFSEFIKLGPVMYPLLLFLHLGMAAESILLIPKIKPKFIVSVSVLAVFLLFDWFDYFMGAMPWLPLTKYNRIIVAFSIASSIIIPLGLAKLPKFQVFKIQ